MSATMTCKKCGSTVSGGIAEVIKWDISHEEYCPATDEAKKGVDE